MTAEELLQWAGQRRGTCSGVACAWTASRVEKVAMGASSAPRGGGAASLGAKPAAAGQTGGEGGGTPVSAEEGRRKGEAGVVLGFSKISGA